MSAKNGQHRKTRLLDRLRRFVLGQPTVQSEECTAQLQTSLEELRQVTETMKQTVAEAKRPQGPAHA